jgi:hypothetical protein
MEDSVLLNVQIINSIKIYMPWQSYILLRTVLYDGRITYTVYAYHNSHVPSYQDLYTSIYTLLPKKVLIHYICFELLVIRNRGSI